MSPTPLSLQPHANQDRNLDAVPSLAPDGTNSRGPEALPGLEAVPAAFRENPDLEAVPEAFREKQDLGAVPAALRRSHSHEVTHEDIALEAPLRMKNFGHQIPEKLCTMNHKSVILRILVPLTSPRPRPHGDCPSAKTQDPSLPKYSTPQPGKIWTTTNLAMFKRIDTSIAKPPSLPSTGTNASSWSTQSP